MSILVQALRHGKCSNHGAPWTMWKGNTTIAGEVYEHNVSREKVNQEPAVLSYTDRLDQKDKIPQFQIHHIDIVTAW